MKLILNRGSVTVLIMMVLAQLACGSSGSAPIAPTRAASQPTVVPTATRDSVSTRPNAPTATSRSNLPPTIIATSSAVWSTSSFRLEEANWFMDQKAGKYVFMWKLKNVSRSPIGFFMFWIEFKDASGKVVGGLQTDTGDIIPPGKAKPFIRLVDKTVPAWKTVEVVRAELVFAGRSLDLHLAEYYDQLSLVPGSEAQADPHDPGHYWVSFEVKNTGKKDARFVTVDCTVYDAMNKMVAVGGVEFEKLLAGASKKSNCVYTLRAPTTGNLRYEWFITGRLQLTQ